MKEMRWVPKNPKLTWVPKRQPTPPSEESVEPQLPLPELLTTHQIKMANDKPAFQPTQKNTDTIPTGKEADLTHFIQKPIVLFLKEKINFLLMINNMIP
jgi:hypothetical protein